MEEQLIVCCDGCGEETTDLTDGYCSGCQEIIQDEFDEVAEQMSDWRRDLKDGRR